MKDKAMVGSDALVTRGHASDGSRRKWRGVPHWLVAGSLAAFALLSAGVSEARLTCADVYGSAGCPTNWGTDGSLLLDAKQSPASVGGSTRESANTMAPVSEVPAIRDSALGLISNRISTNGFLGKLSSLVVPRGIKSCLRGSAQPVEKSVQQTVAAAMQAGQPDCGGPGSTGSHVDNLRWNYVHTGVDYATGDTHHCADQGCNGALDNLPGQMQRLEIKRFHRPLDSWERSSFGPGVYSQFDATIDLIPPDPSAGIPATIELTDPEVDALNVTFTETSSSSGIFKETQTHLYKQLQTFNASGGAPVWFDAVKAVLTAQTGETWVFEILHHFQDPLGRLVQKTDRNGNAHVIAYQFADSATEAQLGYDDEQLFNMTSVTDPYGKKATFDYTNESGRWAVTTVTLPSTMQIFYGYGPDGSGNGTTTLSDVTYPNSDSSYFSFSIDYNLQELVYDYSDTTTPENQSQTANMTQSSWIGPDGLYYTQTPDVLRKVLNPDGETVYQNWEDPTQANIFYVFTAPAKMVRINTANSAIGYPTEVAAALGTAQPGQNPLQLSYDPETYQVDPYAAMTQRSSSTGFTETFARDATTRAVNSVTYPGTIKASATYNSFRQPTSVTDVNGLTHSLTYDSKGNMTKATIASGNAAQAVVNATYNSKGQPLTVTDANGNVTTYGYDSSGNLTSILEPKDASTDTTQAKTTFAYDSYGRVSSKTDPLSHKTSYGYDLRGRLDKVTYPDGKSESYNYVWYGPVTDYVDRNGNTTHYDYDADDRVVTVTRGYGTSVAQALTISYIPGSGAKRDEQVPGTLIHYAYDQTNNVATVTTPTRGALAVTAYTTRDKLGRTTYTQDEEGFKTIYVYDAQNRVSRKIRELGAGVDWTGVNYATVARDASSNPRWAIIDYAYDNAGNATQVTDELGTITKNSYDGQNRLTSKVVASGTSVAETTGYSYDAVGNVTKVVRGRSYGTEGNTTQDNFRDEMTYTGRNLLKTKTEAVGRAEQVTTQTLTYTLTRQKFTEMDGNGKTTTYKYDTNDRLNEVDDPLTHSTKHTYDSIGNMVSSVDGNGRTTKYAYDALNRLTTKTNPAGEATSYTYDINLTDGAGLDAAASGLGFSPLGVGTAVEVTDAQGVPTITISDGLGRVVRQGPYTSSLSQLTTTLYEYATYGVTTPSSYYLVVTATQDGLGNMTIYAKDGNGASRVTTDGEGKVANVTVNARGQNLTLRSPTGTGADWAYDALGRITSVKDTQGSVTATGYDLEDNVVKTTNPLLKFKTYTFDGRNQKVTETDELLKTTKYAYDGTHHLTSMTDSELKVTGYLYDARGLKQQVTYSDGGIATFAYDNGRRLTSMTDQLTHVTTYGYDSADRMTSRTYSDALNDAFTYDKGSRLLSAKSGRYANTIARTYNGIGQLLTEKTTSGSLNLTTTYGYDLAGNINKVTYPNGSVVVPSYNKRAELTKSVLDGVTVATITRDDAGLPTGMAYGNGTAETRGFYLDNLMKSNVLKKGSTTLANLAYTYDAAKRKTAETNGLTSTESQAFTFDDANRPATWAQGTNTQSWTLTATGDWTSTTRNGTAEGRTFDNAHGIKTVASAAVTTDARGSITKDDKSATYTWDFDNQLKSATVSGTTTTYVWDALGRRLSKVAGTITTVFANEGDREDARALAEYDNGAFARLYVYGGDARDEVLVMKAGTAKYYFTHGAQYSVEAVTNDAGAVIERYRYGSFGQQTVLDASGATLLGTTIANRIGFTGRYHDETGLVFFRTRLHDPRLGRFIARDSDFYNGPNLYMAYFVPNLLDPSGRCGLSWSGVWDCAKQVATSSAGTFVITTVVETVVVTAVSAAIPGPAGIILGGALAGAVGNVLGRALTDPHGVKDNLLGDILVGGATGAVSSAAGLGANEWLDLGLITPAQKGAITPLQGLGITILYKGGAAAVNTVYASGVNPLPNMQQPLTASAGGSASSGTAVSAPSGGSTSGWIAADSDCL